VIPISGVRIYYEGVLSLRLQVVVLRESNTGKEDGSSTASRGARLPTPSPTDLEALRLSAIVSSVFGVLKFDPLPLHPFRGE